jgi:putative hydrolase of the HAD superfamily
MHYRAICFDAGFTLVEARRPLKGSVALTLAQQGFEVAEAALDRAMAAADDWFYHEYHRPGNQTWATDEQIAKTWRQFYDLLLGELGIGNHDGALGRLIAANHFQQENWLVYDDVFPVLEQLRAAGYTLGVVSDWSSQLLSLLKHLALSPYFDFILASGAVGAAKPDRRFFELAIAHAAVAPHEALMIGDNYRADVLGARSAGMAALLLDRDGTSVARAGGPIADDVVVIRSLHEVVSIVPS